MKKKLNYYRSLLLSRHPSHDRLRAKHKNLPLFPFRTVIRLGSSTEVEDTLAKGGNRLEINTVKGVKNSASKLLMKQRFTEAGVKTARWIKGNDILDWQFGFPLISKSLHGSRGVGNTKFNTQEELDNWLPGKNLNNYIFEEFIKMTREYRLHVTNDGCFYTCRKLLKNDAPEGTWQKHDDVCSWILEDNPSFKKPNNWNLIVEDCIKAKNALGLDICAFDVMVQGSVNGVERDNPEWNICESCSAPSFGEKTFEKYKEILPILITKKAIEANLIK